MPFLVLPQEAMQPIAKVAVQFGSYQITYGEIRRFASYLQDKGESLGRDLITARIFALEKNKTNKEMRWVNPIIAEVVNVIVETLTPFLGVDIRHQARERIKREERLTILLREVQRLKSLSSPVDDLLLETSLLDKLREYHTLEDTKI